MALQPYIDPKLLDSALNSGKEKPKGDSAIINFAKTQALNFLPQLIQISLQYGVKLGLKQVGNTLLPSDVCPPQSTIDQTVSNLNNLVDDLNKAAKLLNTINKYGKNTKTGIDIAQNIINTTKTALGLATAAEILILPAVPGPVAGGIDTTKSIIDTLFFTEDGTPKLPVLKGNVSSLLSYITIASVFIYFTQGIIETIIAQAEKCSNTPLNIQSLSEETKSFASQGQAIEQGVNSTSPQQETTDSYNGETVEDPTTGITKRRAVGFNRFGIPLVQTPYSFTTNNQSLIEELKLIITKNNLKAE
jgi:hypothetical protein